MKLTKRKGFNFFRSYYDVYNELSDKDKVAFMDALLDRQFLGKKPKDLKGMAKFAYISQTNSIDSQVKGYEDKTGVKLEKNTPTEGGRQGGKDAPTEQVEEKEKGKEQYVTPIQKVLEFDESKHIPQLVQGFKKFCDFVLTLEKVSEIKGQITIDNYRNLCDEFGKDKLWNSMQGLEDWLQDPNVPKGKKNKKSVYHLMKNTWLKNGYGT